MPCWKMLRFNTSSIKWATTALTSQRCPCGPMISSEALRRPPQPIPSRAFTRDTLDCPEVSSIDASLEPSSNWAAVAHRCRRRPPRPKTNRPRGARLTPRSNPAGIPISCSGELIRASPDGHALPPHLLQRLPGNWRATARAAAPRTGRGPCSRPRQAQRRPPSGRGPLRRPAGGQRRANRSCTANVRSALLEGDDD